MLKPHSGHLTAAAQPSCPDLCPHSAASGPLSAKVKSKGLGELSGLGESNRRPVYYLPQISQNALLAFCSWFNLN